MMDADTFLQEFSHLADAPGGVQKLRELVLRFACNGRLTHPEPGDEDTAVALRELNSERKRRIQAKTLTVNNSGVHSFLKPLKDSLPDTWECCQIWEWAELKTGATPSRSKPEYFGGEIKWLLSGDIHRREIHDCTGRITAAGLENSNCKILPPNCVLIALNGQGKTRATVAVLRTPAACNQSLVAMIPILNDVLLPEYLYWNMRSKYTAIRDITGQKQRRGLNMRLIGALAIELPPVSEQKRIVTKVDQLMALCDELEEKQRKKRETSTRLNNACLDSLLAAREVEEFEMQWGRIMKNFSELYCASENIPLLKGAVVQLITQGRVHMRSSRDGSALTLLKSIQKDRIAQAVGVKKQKKILEASLESDGPVPLPEGWCWTTLGNLCLKVADGPHYSPKYVSKEKGVPFLSARNIRQDRFVWDDVKYVSRADHEKFCERIRPMKGDILYTKGGTTGVAKENDLDFEFSVWVHVAVLKIAKDQVLPEYLTYVLNSPFCYRQSQKLTHGIGNKDLGLTRMVNIILPLPPLAAQKSVVRELARFLPALDELEMLLSNVEAHQSALVSAFVNQFAVT